VVFKLDIKVFVMNDILYVTPTVLANASTNGKIKSITY